MTAALFALSSIFLALKLFGKEDYQKPIGFLAGKEDILPLGKDYGGSELEDDMLVLCVLTEDLLDRALSPLKRGGLGDLPYKAVMTETNQYWNGLALFEALRKEHKEAHQK